MDFAPEWPLMDRLIAIVLSRPKFRKRFGIAGTAPLPFTAPYVRPKNNLPPGEPIAATIAAVEHLIPDQLSARPSWNAPRLLAKRASPGWPGNNQEFKMSAPRYLTAAEVSERFEGRIAVRTLANWRTLGTGPKFTKIGGRVLYRTDVLDEWERTRTVESTSEYRK